MRGINPPNQMREALELRLPIHQDANSHDATDGTASGTAPLSR